MTSSVYALVDPRSAAVRYVGVTKLTLACRLGGHIGSARRGESTHRGAWVRSLLAAGLRPAIALLEETGDRRREVHWIKVLRESGAALTNATDGGDGCVGLPPEARRRIGAALSLRNKTPQARDWARQAGLRRTFSAETRAKLSAASLGRKHGPPRAETLDRMRATKRGHAVSAETRRKISAALSGRRAVPCSPEKRLKISAAKRAAKELRDAGRN